MSECTCFEVDPKYWTTHYGAVDPATMHEPNPDCPVHFPMKIRLPIWITIGAGADGYLVICKCGWVSPEHPSMDRVVAMAEQHLDITHNPKP